MALIGEFRNKSCDECPRLKLFLKQHIVQQSIKENCKVKTLAKNVIRWEQVGENKYIYPGTIKVLHTEDAFNGELWEIERPLFPLPLII